MSERSSVPAGGRPTAGPGTVRGFMAGLSPAGRGFLLLLVLLLVSMSTFAAFYPRRVTPASAPPDRFSAERALAHLPTIAREPHPAGSAAQAHVREYLIAQLAATGLQAEVQKTLRLENVVARLRGTNPTGAIVVLAHYDSVFSGPGAADNGSGVVALLEVMRALAAGPALRNDVIALFDDSEENGPFLGSRTFVAEHRWMPDVRLAIGLDTAVAGFISVNETGPNNGWLVQALARAYTGGHWTSATGGGYYDYGPFRSAGIQGLELEDNYPFRQQHTARDLPEIVRPATVQQMGDQTLSIVREVGGLDLANPFSEPETFFSLPMLGLVHYPQAWSMPLAIAAGIFLVLALGLALWRGLASWRGLVIGLMAIPITAASAFLGARALWPRAPRLVGWDTGSWPMWPEVIPPYGWLVAASFGLLVLILAVAVYSIARRWSARADFSLAGLVPFLLVAVWLAGSLPHAAYVPVWILVIGSLGWIAAAAAGGNRLAWSVDLAALVTAVPLLVLLLPFLPGTIMGDGMKSLANLAAVWAWLLLTVLPAIDGLLVRIPFKQGSSHTTPKAS